MKKKKVILNYKKKNNEIRERSRSDSNSISEGKKRISKIKAKEFIEKAQYSFLNEI